MRELVALGEVEVRWIETKKNISDVLSKGSIEPAQYEALRRELLNGAAPRDDGDANAGSVGTAA